MNDSLKKAWTDVVQPLISRPRQLQVAALCVKGKGKDLRVLMITSRGTGRWIIPKGWPMDGISAYAAALTEAWEEAGVKKADIDPKPIGSFTYDKVMDNGVPVPVEAQVYLARVEKLVDDYPEADQRRRKWMTPKRAAEQVAEPGLRALLLAL